MTVSLHIDRRRCGRAIASYLLAVAAAAVYIYIVLRSTGLPPIQIQAKEPIHIGDGSKKTGPRKVLLVHSYHRGYPWVDAITRGVHMALAKHGIQIETFHMDTKRHTDETWKRDSGNKAKEIVAQWHPDVVIAADDNAQQYFAKDYAGRNRPSIVFCGVNAELSAYGYPASNVTGVLERPHFAESLTMLSRLLDAASRVAVISDDSPTSTGAIANLNEPPSPWRIVSCQQPSTFQEWQSAVKHVQNQADAIAVYTYHTVKQSGNDASMEPSDVMAWTVTNSRLPVVGFFDFAIDDGALCGYLESGVEHGLKAGQMAWEILQGTPPEKMPVITALDGQAMINLESARRLDIEVPARFLDDNITLVRK